MLVLSKVVPQKLRTSEPPVICFPGLWAACSLSRDLSSSKLPFQRGLDALT